MLLPGCQCCGTPPCDPCTRTCQNPHSGAAFQEVSRGYSFGAVNGLASDGYLTFSGDEDNPAFIPGGGPFHQAIGGSFYLSSAQTRFPCSLSVSFWRTLFPADATTDTALSSNTVTFTCVSGQFFLPTVGVTLNPGDTYTFSNAVPLVSLFSGDPRSSVGSFGGFATCDNTQIGVQARIDWSSSERVHVLHGIVRECYEEGTPCSNFCGDSLNVPMEIYLTLTSLTLTNASSAWLGAPSAMASFNSAFATISGSALVLKRSPYICNLWTATFTGSNPFSWRGSLCRLYVAYNSYLGLLYLSSTVNYVAPDGNTLPLGGCNESLSINFPISVPCISGGSYDRSGSVSSTGNASVSSGNVSYGGVLMDASTGWRIQA